MNGLNDMHYQPKYFEMLNIADAVSNALHNILQSLRSQVKQFFELINAVDFSVPLSIPGS